MTHAAPPHDSPNSAPNEAVLALLPWYVNGTLPDDERARVERLIRQSPQMQDEVLWLESVRRQIRDAVPEQAGEAGLARLRALIQADQSGAVTLLPARGNRDARVGKHWTVPAALAATILLAVMAAFVYLPQRDGTLEPLSGQTATSAAAILQVTFKASAPEGEIRQLISSIQGEIVSGPGALGVYSLRVQRGHAGRAMATLIARKDLVESVSLVAK